MYVTASNAVALTSGINTVYVRGLKVNSEVVLESSSMKCCALFFRGDEGVLWAVWTSEEVSSTICKFSLTLTHTRI